MEQNDNNQPDAGNDSRIRISVALATCGGGSFLGGLLASLFSQTRIPDEIVVCDDVSTDNTVEIINSYIRQYPGVIKLFVNDRRLGASANFALTVSRCTGDIIFLADQDDLWEKDKISVMSTAIISAPSRPAAAFCDSFLIDEKGGNLGVTHWQLRDFSPEKWQKGKEFDFLLRRVPAAGHNMAFEKDFIPYILPLPELDEVHDTFIALIIGGVGSWQLIDRRLTAFRQHTGNLSGMYRGRGRWEQALYAIKFRRDEWNYRLFAALFERLSAVEGIPAEKLAQIRARMAYSLARSQLSPHFAGRVIPALKLLFSGKYHRFGRGIANFVQDVFLRSFCK